MVLVRMLGSFLETVPLQGVYSSLRFGLTQLNSIKITMAQLSTVCFESRAVNSVLVLVYLSDFHMPFTA